MDIETFRQQILDKGTVSPARFDVSLTFPGDSLISISALDQRYAFITEFQKMMPYRALAVNVPGVTFLDNQTNPYGAGSRIHQPYNAVPTEIKVVMLADKNGTIEEFFRFWMNLVFNYSYDMTNVTQVSFTANYRDQVCGNIVIWKYANDGSLVNIYTMYNVLPVGVSPIELAWDATNQVMKFVVTFKCQSFTIV